MPCRSRVNTIGLCSSGARLADWANDLRPRKRGDRAGRDVCFWHLADIQRILIDVRYWGDCVAKLFSRPNRATLIQERTQTRSIDSKKRSGGFDYCALATQQRSFATQSGVKRTCPTLILLVHALALLWQICFRRRAVEPSSAVRASLRRSKHEIGDGVTDRWQAWLRRWSVDSFFPVSLLRGGDAGGRRKQSLS